MRILTFSTLYPSRARETHGVFVENRLRHFKTFSGNTPLVIAPVPYFPSTSPRFGSYADFACSPQEETRHGIKIYHPRYPVIPKFGMTLAPILLYLGVRKLVGRLLNDGPGFDLIDGHYFYPDGVAVALLAREFDLPFTLTARGTDLNLIPSYKMARRQILWAANRAQGLITVSAALKQVLLDLGIDEAGVQVLRNGVDLEMFHPCERSAVRAKLGVSGKVLVSVGHLVERKGHHLVIEALAKLPGFELIIVGTGPMRGQLEQLASKIGVASRVQFVGSVAHDALFEIYGAADALVLASSREGWPNVLLEAMACGTPVVATDVWGSGEVVRAPQAGRLAPERSPECLAKTIERLFAEPPERSATRAYAEGFSWDETSQGQLALFSQILA